MWYTETEGPVVIIWGISSKCEGPFQRTDVKTS